jgi:peptide/nickel transport system permease protein
LSTAAIRPQLRERRLPITASGVLVGLSLAYLLLLAVMVIAPGVFTGHDPSEIDILARLSGPSMAHPLGTDELGRDLLARIAFGARNSFGVSLLVVGIAVAVGLLVGTVAGWVAGSVDNLLMRTVDLFLAFPAFVLAMALAAALEPGLRSIMIALAIIWWPTYARLVRGAVLGLKHAGHVEAAVALGLPRRQIIWRHVLRFVWRDINVRATADIGYALMAVTALSFLGLGAQSPTPEWGLLIRSSSDYFYVAWWYMAFPGLAVTLTAVSLSILGDWIAARKRH